MTTMKKYPDDYAYALQRLLKHSVATALAVALAAAFLALPNPPSMFKGLGAPIAILASAYLVFFATPFCLGRVLSLAEWASFEICAALYASWCTALVFAICGFSISLLQRILGELASYVDSNGYVVIAISASSAVAYLAARHTKIRRSDFFALMPTACLLNVAFIMSFLNTEKGAASSVPIFVLLTLAASFAGLLGTHARKLTGDET